MHFELNACHEWIIGNEFYNRRQKILYVEGTFFSIPFDCSLARMTVKLLQRCNQVNLKMSSKIFPCLLPIDFNSNSVALHLMKQCILSVIRYSEIPKYQYHFIYLGIIVRLSYMCMRCLAVLESPCYPMFVVDVFRIKFVPQFIEEITLVSTERFNNGIQQHL